MYVLLTVSIGGKFSTYFHIIALKMENSALTFPPIG